MNTKSIELLNENGHAMAEMGEVLSHLSNCDAQVAHWALERSGAMRRLSDLMSAVGHRTVELTNIEFAAGDLPAPVAGGKHSQLAKDTRQWAVLSLVYDGSAPRTSTWSSVAVTARANGYGSRDYAVLVRANNGLLAWVDKDDQTVTVTDRGIARYKEIQQRGLIGALD